MFGFDSPSVTNDRKRPGHVTAPFHYYDERVPAAGFNATKHDFSRDTLAMCGGDGFWLGTCRQTYLALFLVPQSYRSNATLGLKTRRGLPVIRHSSKLCAATTPRFSTPQAFGAKIGAPTYAR